MSKNSRKIKLNELPVTFKDCLAVKIPNNIDRYRNFVPRAIVLLDGERLVKVPCPAK